MSLTLPPDVLSHRSGPGAALRTPRLLLVDPERKDRRRFAALLEQAGYGVTPARSAREARRTAAGIPYDAVIIEARLPDARGLALARWFRRYAPATAVILHSAAADWETYFRAIEAGARDAVSKLSPPSELLRVVGLCVRPPSAE